MDVINEAIDDATNTLPFNLRNCFWFRKLGTDFIKDGFMFANEAVPQVQLYYNEYGIETLGSKANRTLDLVNWVRSEGVPVHGVGLQWHIDVSTNVTPDDEHYQSAQQFVDQRIDFIVAELDIAIPTTDGYPSDPKDLLRQGLLYRSLLQYVLHFSLKCRAMLTWGYTDRYSWIPSFHNNTAGAALPLDWMYLPKPAYWQLQEELGRVLPDGNYRLSPQSLPNQCLGVSNESTSDAIQLYDEPCQSNNQIWNIIGLDDGTYRFSSTSQGNRVLSAVNATAPIGEVHMTNWTNSVNEAWAFSPRGRIYSVSSLEQRGGECSLFINNPTCLSSITIVLHLIIGSSLPSNVALITYFDKCILSLADLHNLTFLFRLEPFSRPIH